jgi:hypothetical protein
VVTVLAPVAAEGTSAMRDLRCLIGMHNYHATTNDEGGKYLVCSRCNKEDYPGSSFNTVPNG